MMRRTRRFDLGAVVLGAVILLVGGWYFLRNTLGFNMDELDWDLIWPALVIVLGAGILYRAMTDSRHEGPTQ